MNAQVQVGGGRESFSLEEARAVANWAAEMGIKGPRVGNQDFFGEGDIYLIALLIIYRDEGCDTAFLRESLKSKLVFSPSDRMPLENRPDYRIDQIIRNLVSHRTLERYGYAQRRQGRWFITEKGERVLALLGWI